MGDQTFFVELLIWIKYARLFKSRVRRGQRKSQHLLIFHFEKTFPFQNGHFFQGSTKPKVTKATLCDALGFQFDELIGSLRFIALK